MSQIKVELKLSTVFEILSHELSVVINELLKGGVRFGRLFLRALKRQIHFFISFNYTKENIRKHLLEKAASFFGMEIVEDKLKKKGRSKPKKKKARHIYKGDRLKKHAISNCKSARLRKKRKINQKNTYVPIE